jgi:hypothetical protein
MLYRAPGLLVPKTVMSLIARPRRWSTSNVKLWLPLSHALTGTHWMSPLPSVSWTP